MTSRHPAITVGLLIWLALLLQFSRLQQGLGLDLVFMLVVLCAFRWRIAGGLFAGLWGGALVAAVTGGAWTVTSVYLAVGLVAAALRETVVHPGLGHHLGVALGLTALFLAARAWLLSLDGLTLTAETLALAVATHAVLLTLLLEAARLLPLAPKDRSHDHLQNLILQ